MNSIGVNIIKTGLLKAFQGPDSGAEYDPRDFETAQKIVLMKLSYLLGVVLLFGYGAYNALFATRMTGVLELILAALLIALSAGVRRKKSYDAAVYISSISGAFFFLFLAYVKEPGNLLFSLCIPVYVLFLLGRRNGLLFSSTYATVLTALVSPWTPWTPGFYDTSYFANFLAIYFIVTVLAILYVIVRDRIDHSIIQKNIDLKKTQEYFLNIVNALDDPVFVIGEQGRLITTNDAARELLSLDEDEIMAADPSELSNHFPWLHDHDREVLDSNAPIVYDDDFNRNGELRHLSIKKSAFTDFSTGKRYIAGTIRDMTDRVRNEQFIDESRRSYKSLYDEAPVGYHEIDLSGAVIRVNATEAAMLGYAVEEMIGRPIFDFIAPEEREIAERAFSEKISGQIPFPVNGFERKYIMKSGKRIDLFMLDKPIYDENNRLVRVRSTQQNITSRKQLDEQMKTRDIFVSMEAMASGIAHDFNNLLASIMGGIEMARIDHDTLTHEQQEYLAVAYHSAVRAANLVKEFLRLSLEQRSLMTMVDVYRVTSRAIGLLNHEASCPLRNQVAFVPGEFYIRGDEDELVEMMSILGRNAADAIKAAGREEAGYIRYDATVYGAEPGNTLGIAPGKYICIAVRDNGMGMTPDVKKYAFSPLFTTRDRGVKKGQGLGLSRAYSIIRGHQGAVTIDSEHGVGTTVSIYFPVAVEEPSVLSPALIERSIDPTP